VNVIIMKYRNRLMLSIWLMAAILAWVSPNTAAQTRASTTVEQPVARVLKATISRRQVELGSQERKDAKRKYKGAEYEKWVREYQAELLVSLILNPLLREYATAHAITASADEINSLSRALFGQRIARGATKVIAEQTVIQWKLSKALYQQYGGTVIFQQSNPFEPVGAFQKFLEEQEQKKAFEIFDPQLRQAFWCYFTCEQIMIVPPDEVNYDVPWWLQKPSTKAR
jgi:hypothetical protein